MCRPIRIAVAAIVFGSIPDAVIAQPDWVGRVERSIARTVEGGPEWVLAKYHLSRANLDHDIVKSEQHCAAGMAAAERLGDANLIAAGTCVRALITGLQGSSEESSRILQGVTFDDAAGPEARLLFAEADCRFGDSARSDAATARRLCKFAKQVSACKDDILRAGGYVSVAQQYARTEGGMGPIIDDATAAANRSGVLSFAVELDRLKLLESLEQGTLAEPPVAALREIAARARGCGAVKTEVESISAMVSLAHMLDQPALELQHDVHRAIEAALHVESDSIRTRALDAASRFANQHGPTLAGRQVAERLDSLSHLVGNRKRQPLSRGSIVESIETGLPPSEPADRSTTSNEVDNPVRAQSFTAVRHAMDQRYLIVCGIATLVGIGLAGFLFVSRRRLRQVNQELLAEMAAGNRVRSEQAQLKRRMSRLQRMDSLGALAGGVAHDFNNLLVGVLCNAELIQSDSVTDDVKEDCLQGIIDAAEAASDLSQMMMAYTGKHPARTEIIELGELLVEMLPLFRAASLKHEIEVDPFTEPVFTLADATQIEQALLNLVSNAVTALEDVADGRVTIRLGSITIDRVDEPHFHGRRSEGGKFAFIDVVDNGRGIADDEIEHIFEPFYSEGNSGRGLGLAVVYGNIIRHDGLIHCRSKLGEGTVMRVLLPAAHPIPTPPVIPEETVTTHAFQGGHAVVIDDEPSVLQTLERMLVSNGWTCDTYQKPMDALAKLDDCAWETDCVVVDVRMPEMDGRAVVQHLLERHPSLPVTVVSGYSQINLHDFQRFPNVVNTLVKPFSTNSVLGSLEQAVKPR